MVQIEPESGEQKQFGVIKETTWPTLSICHLPGRFAMARGSLRSGGHQCQVERGLHDPRRPGGRQGEIINFKI